MNLNNLFKKFISVTAGGLFSSVSVLAYVGTYDGTDNKNVLWDFLMLTFIGLKPFIFIFVILLFLFLAALMFSIVREVIRRHLPRI